MYGQVYFLANTTVVGSFFSLTIPLHFPFQFPPTELCSLCFAYVLAPLLLYAYSPILFLSLSPSFSRRLLSKQEKRRDLSRLYEPTPVVRSETPAPSNRGQRWNTLEHTYEYDCSSRLYRLGDRKFLISWLYTGHRAFLETMR